MMPGDMIWYDAHVSYGKARGVCPFSPRCFFDDERLFFCSREEFIVWLRQVTPLLLKQERSPGVR